ncbi:MAG: cation:proton antiporter, partial [Pseudomonadota bacterium]
LALSSTAVGIQILSDKGDLAARFGRVTFSVLLFQDLAVVVLLVMLTTLGQEGVHVVHELGYAGLKAICALLVILAAGRLVLRPLYRTVASIDNPELFIAVTLLVVLMTGVVTAFVGLPMELGAFLAGMLLSETEYRHQVEADIHPFRGLLLGLFFMSVGMSIDLQAVWSNAIWVAVTLCSLLVVKTFLVLVLGRVFSLPFMTSLRTSLLLAGAGEFVFVLFALAMEQGLVPLMVGQFLFVVAALSMGLTPLLDRIGKLLEDKYSQKKGDVAIRSALEELDDLRNHVIIAGFGRLGKLVGRLLAERMVPFVAIDKDMKIVNEGRAKGMPVFYGDARRTPMLRALGADRAKTIVVCLNNTNMALRTALMIRRHFKQAGVCVRLRDETHKATLTKAGIAVVMPENLEPSLQVAGSVLSSLGNSEVEVEQAIEAFRRTLTTVTVPENPNPEVQV